MNLHKDDITVTYGQMDHVLCQLIIRHHDEKAGTIFSSKYVKLTVFMQIIHFILNENLKSY